MLGNFFDSLFLSKAKQLVGCCTSRQRQPLEKPPNNIPKNRCSAPNQQIIRGSHQEHHGQRFSLQPQLSKTNLDDRTYNNNNNATSNWFEPPTTTNKTMIQNRQLNKNKTKNKKNQLKNSYFVRKSSITKSLDQEQQNHDNKVSSFDNIYTDNHLFYPVQEPDAQVYFQSQKQKSSVISKSLERPQDQRSNLQGKRMNMDQDLFYYTDFNQRQQDENMNYTNKTSGDEFLKILQDENNKQDLSEQDKELLLQIQAELQKLQSQQKNNKAQ